MSLADFDIDQHLRMAFAFYLSEKTIPFSDLQNLITNKTHILKIHQDLTNSLNIIRNEDKNSVLISLQEKAYQNQIEEDEREKNRDLGASQREQTQKNNLTKELILEKITLNTQRNDLEAITLEQIHHTHPHDHNNVHQHQISSLESALKRNEIRRKIDSLSLRINTIEQNLSTLDDQSTERESRRTQRESRIVARLQYIQKKPGIGIENTLSTQNQSFLLTNIQQAHQALDQKYNSLTNRAKQSNYPIFLEELEKHLCTSRRAAQEIEALRSIIKFMKQHLNNEKETTIIQSDLNKINTTLANNKNELENLNTKLSSLKQENPNLINANKDLKAQNLALDSSLFNNINQRNRLFRAVQLLSIATLVSSIPLILTLIHIIPFFIAPVFLFILVTAPPAVLLTTTIIVGIAALIYAIKARSNKSSMQTNQCTIDNNNGKMSQNLQGINLLENQTIPNLTSKTKTDENTKKQLTTSLEISQGEADRTLTQAKDVTPFTYSSTSFLHTIGKNPSATVIPSAPPMDETTSSINQYSNV